MRQLQFTLYRDKKTSYGNSKAMSWAEWLPYFLEHEHRGRPNDTNDERRLEKSKDGAAIILGKIDDTESRSSIAVEHVDALSLDLEHLNAEQYHDIFDVLEPYEYAAYTTHTSGSQIHKGEQRWRIILPLAESVLPDNFATAWQGLNKYIGGFNDPATKDISRLNFFPSTFDPSKASAKHHRGKWLHIRDLIQAQQTSTRKTITDIVQIRQWIRRTDKADELKNTLSSLSIGAPFADKGARHTAIVNITWRLARQFEELPLRIVRDLFEKSLKNMGPDAPPFEEVERAYKDAITKIDAEPQIMQRAFFGEDAEPYTDDDLSDMAVEIGCTVEQLTDKWVVFRDGIYFVLEIGGFYSGPFTKEDAVLLLHRRLARAPINIVQPTKDGYRPRKFEEIVAEYGTPARKLVASMITDDTYFDAATGTMHEAVCPKRDIMAKEHPEIERWLKLLAADSYPKLKDWLSVMPDLRHPLCAIYFAGTQGSGKTLLATGLARIWTDGAPTTVDHLVSNWNDDLTSCPVILADEEIPKRGRDTITAFLRSLISEYSRKLKRRYRPNMDLQGCIRLILAANNENMLESKDVSTTNDFQAISRRFLFVQVDDRATKYLETLDKDLKEYWANKGIAEHVLWLSQTHTVDKPGKRFIVEGEPSAMHRLLLFSSHYNSLVCEWLVRYLINPSKFARSVNRHMIKTDSGRLLVNTQALCDNWLMYLPTISTDPNTKKIATALRSIQVSDKRYQCRVDGHRLTFWDINIDHLMAWSKQYNIGDHTMLIKGIRHYNPELIIPVGEILGVG
jgi:hypothetical protein